MANINIIELKKREEFGTTKSRELRNKSFVPGVIYGDNIESRHFYIEERFVPKIKKASDKTGLFDVQIEGEEKPVKAIIQKIEKHPVTGRFQHIDLYQARMDRKLHTEVDLVFSGESFAVQNLGGILVKQHDKIPVECLPQDLIHSIEVPIEKLAKFGDAIKVKDLDIPEGIETRLDPEDIVIAVSEPRSEKELEDLQAEVSADVNAVEVTTEKKEEPQEGAEKAEA